MLSDKFVHFGIDIGRGMEVDSEEVTYFLWFSECISKVCFYKNNLLVIIRLGLYTHCIVGINQDFYIFLL